MYFFRSFVSTNRHILRLTFILSFLLLLNGCAVMAGMPVPLKIASNIHSGYTLYKNLDNNPENDSWYVSYLKSIFVKDDEPEPLYEIHNSEKTIALNNEPIPAIKL